MLIINTMVSNLMRQRPYRCIVLLINLGIKDYFFLGCTGATVVTSTRLLRYSSIFE